MAKPNPKLQLPEPLKTLVKDVGQSVSLADVDSYARLRQIEDRSHQIRTIVRAWRDQQTQDRKMRDRYAIYLIVAMGIQALAVNVFFVLIGCGAIAFEAWTARTFIMSVFAEIAAMVLIVVKYLFTPSSEAVLRFLAEQKEKIQRSRR
jgi:hypothetical protein